MWSWLGLRHPALQPAGAPGCCTVGTLLAHGPCPIVSLLTSQCQSSLRVAPFPLEVLGIPVLLYSGRLEKQKGRCPSSEGGGRGLPGAASIAGVPALCPLGCLLLTQQVRVDEVEDLIWADGQDVALTIGARFVQQHHVEVVAGEVQELPEGAEGSWWLGPGPLLWG